MQSIGKSYENRDMTVLTLGVNIDQKEGKSRSENPPSIFMTSVHHAREVVGVTMNLYIILKLLHAYTHNDPGVTELLRMHNIYSLPMVNVDGYALISDIWEKQHTFEIVRKNRRNEGGCEGVSIGVDLNRNYGYKWGLDNQGSTNNKCEEDYRGTEAFSEPETRAIRDFIQKNDKNIKITINFHTWGNLFIIPFNYADQWNKEMIDKDIYKMYEDVRDNGGLPQGMLFGNGKQTIQYTANGDATDWMATQNGIMSISPELGTQNRMTDKFFPNQEWVQPILEENFPWVNYTIYKLSSQIETKITRFTKIECQGECSEEDKLYQKFKIEVQVQNLGFSEVKNVQVQLQETSPLEITTVDDKDKYDAISMANILRHDKLKSLETKSWILGARILNEHSELVANKTYLELINVKYPHFDSSQKNTRTLNGFSLLTSEVNATITNHTSGSSRVLKFILLFAVAMIVVVAAI